MPDDPIEITKTPAETENWPGLWRSFRNEMETLFHRFDGGLGIPAVRRLMDIEPFWGRGTVFSSLVPAIDVTEDDKGYAITAELPGLDEKNVTVSLSGATLIVKGEKSVEKEETAKNRYVSERNYGAFERSFRLPETVDRDKIAASFAKGILTVTLPKTAEASAPSKKIDVKAA